MTSCRNEEMQGKFEMKEREGLEVGQEDWRFREEYMMRTVQKGNMVHCEVASFPLAHLGKQEAYSNH